MDSFKTFSAQLNAYVSQELAIFSETLLKYDTTLVYGDKLIRCSIRCPEAIEEGRVKSFLE